MKNGLGWFFVSALAAGLIAVVLFVMLFMEGCSTRGVAEGPSAGQDGDTVTVHLTMGRGKRSAAPNPTVVDEGYQTSPDPVLQGWDDPSAPDVLIGEKRARLEAVLERGGGGELLESGGWEEMATTIAESSPTQNIVKIGQAINLLGEAGALHLLTYGLYWAHPEHEPDAPQLGAADTLEIAWAGPQWWTYRDDSTSASLQSIGVMSRWWRDGVWLRYEEDDGGSYAHPESVVADLGLTKFEFRELVDGESLFVKLPADSFEVRDLARQIERAFRMEP